MTGRAENHPVRSTRPAIPAGIKRRCPARPSRSGGTPGGLR